MVELTDGEGMSNVQAADVLGVDEGTVRGDKRASENSDSAKLPGLDPSENSEPPSEPETPPLPVGEFKCIVINPPTTG